MRPSFYARILLVCAAVTISTGLQAQTRFVEPRVDLGVTYSPEHSQLAPGNCNCFWLQGGGAEASLTLWKGLGIAGSVTSERISNYANGIDFNRLTYAGGLGYRHNVGERLQIFGHGLGGRAHAFSGAFPSSTGLLSTANSLVLQTGGGLDLPLSNRFAVRLLEAEYVRTQLPNGYANTQNDLRLSTGLTVEFGHL
jgi:hypothetical protein